MVSRRTFTGALAGALAALGFPRVLPGTSGRLAASSPDDCIYFTSDFETWDDWTAPGLELPPSSRLLRVRPALEPGGVSMLQVGCEGNIYCPPVPLTPAIWYAIMAGLDRHSDRPGGASLYAIGPAEAAHRLDYVEEDEPAVVPA